MSMLLPDGIWPTMITPFHDDGTIDFPSLKRLVDWYIDQGVDGLFAVCQSSEMFHLSLEEKVRLAEASIDAAAGRVPVICSGHTADTLPEQVHELQTMAATGVEAVVLIVNRLAARGEGEESALRNLREITAGIPPEVPLGFYECPYPYKRLISPEILEYSIASGRYSFLKDTCCDSRLIQERLVRLRGTGFKLFNANSATLSLSLAAGASGYSGVMANFHPSLYRKLVTSQREEPGSADDLQNLLGAVSAIEDEWYPMTAKYHLSQLGIIESIYTRKHASAELDENHRLMVEQMGRLF